ncbi:SIMPL domain-containing protein [Sphingomonas horti]|nr:SIMPL domain-containing protein [Sphingomonas horti]
MVSALLRTVLAATAAIAAATAAHAQGGPISPALPAPGQVLLQLLATGSVTLPADRAAWRVQLVCKGKTLAEARQASKARLDQLASALRAAGGDAVKLQAVAPNGPFGFIGNEQYGDAVAALAATGLPDATSVPQEKTIVSSYEVTLADLSRTSLVRAAIESVANGGSDPVYRLNDADNARRKAGAQALAKASLDAQAYAAAAGMKLGPMTRLANVGPAGIERWNQELQARIFGAPEPPGTVTTTETVYVDFVLNP